MIRLPRRTLQVQLTLLYAVPFVISGALLMAIPLFGVSNTTPANGTGTVPPPSVEVDTGFHRLLGVSAIGFVVMIAISLVLGWFIAGRFLRPLRTITATARDISATNLDRRLGLDGRNDEFAELARTLDGLFERLQRSFDSQRHFVANASHELRTPLTAERALLQVALSDPDADAETLRVVCQETLALGRHQERLIAGLLTLSTSEQGVEQREPADLAEVAAQVLTSREVEFRSRGLRLDSSLAAAPTSGDPHLVASLVANLVDNALRHNVPGGHIAVRTEVVDGQARVTVANSGPVIPADQVERLFEPFQRLGRERLRHDGHGLGLAIVRAIATAHGASVTPHVRPEGGLTIDVTFPPS